MRKTATKSLRWPSTSALRCAQATMRTAGIRMLGHVLHASPERAVEGVEPVEARFGEEFCGFLRCPAMRLAPEFSRASGDHLDYFEVGHLLVSRLCKVKC